MKIFCIHSIYSLKGSFFKTFAVYIDDDLKKDEVNIMSWKFSQLVGLPTFYSSILGEC